MSFKCALTSKFMIFRDENQSSTLTWVESMQTSYETFHNFRIAFYYCFKKHFNFRKRFLNYKFNLPMDKEEQHVDMVEILKNISFLCVVYLGLFQNQNSLLSEVERK